MKKSRLQGALEDARGGAVLTSESGCSVSNNSEDGGEEKQPHRIRPSGSQRRTKASPRPEAAFLSPNGLKQTADPTTLQSVYFRVKERCVEPEEVIALTAAQVPIAVQAMRQVISQMHEASVDVFACPALLRALGTESTTPPTGLESQQAIEQPCKDASGWYTLGKVVGRGTFGRVYHGHHRLSSSRVAIKTYVRNEGSKVCCSSTVASSAVGSRRVRSQAQHQQHSGDALDWKRVRQEARVMERLRPHPNVVRYFESFESATRFDLVMELVEGRDLCDHLRQQPGQKLGEKSARRVFSALCSAVGSLHAQDIIHRDLKLENVLLEAPEEGERRPVLIDFGFSELGPDAPSSTASPPSTATEASKNFCGTPSYMAPEVLVSQRYSGKAADVWSLGVILYVLLCGKFPFHGASLQQLHQNARNPRQLSFPKSISPGSQAMVRAILVADPARRPSARQILAHEWFATTTRATRAMSSASTDCFNAMKRSPSASVDPQSLEAFSNWESGHEMIGDALTDLYGLDQAVLLSAPRDQRLDRVATFVKVAAAAAGRTFMSLLREQPPSNDDEHDENTSVAESRGGSEHEPVVRMLIPLGAAPDRALEPASSHKQQLEQIIGLVKHSLRV